MAFKILFLSLPWRLCGTLRTLSGIGPPLVCNYRVDKPKTEIQSIRQYRVTIRIYPTNGRTGTLALPSRVSCCLTSECSDDH